MGLAVRLPKAAQQAAGPAAWDTARGKQAPSLQLKDSHTHEALHGPSRAQALLTDGGASDGAGREGAKGKAGRKEGLRTENRVEID